MQSSAIEPLKRASFCRATPSLDVSARRSELKYGRRRYVAILRGVTFFECVRAMKHPDVAVGIRSRTADTAEQHTLRHGGEMGIHFENRQDRIWLLVLRYDRSPAKKAAKTADCESRKCSPGEGLPIHATVPPSTVPRQLPSH